MKKTRILIKSILLLSSVLLFTGCIGMFQDIYIEKQAYKTIKTDGIYRLKRVSDDKSKIYYTAIHFISNKDEKDKLEYAYITTDINNKILTKYAFIGGYNIHCHKKKCEIQFWNDKQKNGVSTYSVRLDENNMLYNYSGGTITNYKFIKNK